MARLTDELLERSEAFADRTLRVASELDRQHVSRRVVDQLTAAGTSVGANLFEADEAMSRKDFIRCVAIAVKELNETRFWLRLAGRSGWVENDRLHPLLVEAEEMRRVLGSIIARTKKAQPAKQDTD